MTIKGYSAAVILAEIEYTSKKRRNYKELTPWSFIKQEDGSTTIGDNPDYKPYTKEEIREIENEELEKRYEYLLKHYPNKDYAKRYKLEKLKNRIDMKKLMKIAKESAIYGKDGEVLLAKDDEWREDNEWNRAWDEEQKEFNNHTFIVSEEKSESFNQMKRCEKLDEILENAKKLGIKSETTLDENAIDILISQMEKAKNMPKHTSNIDIEENMEEGKRLLNEHLDKRKEEFNNQKPMMVIKEDKVEEFLSQKRDDEMWNKIEGKARSFRRNKVEDKSDWDVIADIFQKAFKEKGMTKEEISEMSEQILKQVRDDMRREKEGRSNL